jgi:hypothetical protein
MHTVMLLLLKLAICLAAALTLLSFIVRATLRLALARWVHHFTVGSIGWDLSLRQVEWEGAL